MTADTSQHVERLQQRVEQLERQLLQQQRLTLLGELVGTTTHEFNNVLTTILNYARLGRRSRDEATRDKSLEKILSAAERAARLTNSILGAARNRADQLVPTDLTQLVEDTLLLLERELNVHRVQVQRQFAPLPRAMLQANQIQQVLMNLLINARQAMPQGGVVVVRLQHDAQNDMVELSVRDTGQGIPEDQLPRIFDPFYSTKSGPDASGKGGTGLGLATCRRIVESHRGQIRVRSTVGKGTEFTIRLPIAVVPAAVPAPPVSYTGSDATTPPASAR